MTCSFRLDVVFRIFYFCNCERLGIEFASKEHVGDS